MSELTRSKADNASRLMLSKVPEITVLLWVIKILCTTAGELRRLHQT